MKHEHQLISIVIPVFNEENNIQPLYTALVPELPIQNYRFDIIFVDDGSTDRSADRIRDLHEKDSRVKLISLSRNFGHQLAVTAGLEHAQGAAAIMMDADLQHPPELVPQLIAHWEDGYDVAYTVRETTEGVKLLKRFTSALFYFCINKLVSPPISPGGADFRLIDRRVVDCLNSLPEQRRFLRGLIAWGGFRQIAVPYTAHPRHSGSTKYSFSRMLAFAVDGITSFSTSPLRCAMYFGIPVTLLGVGYAIWAAGQALRTEVPHNAWPPIIATILFLSGLQLFSVGILGEYIGRIYEEVKRRPLYLARDRIGFDDSLGQPFYRPHRTRDTGRPPVVDSENASSVSVLPSTMDDQLFLKRSGKSRPL